MDNKKQGVSMDKLEEKLHEWYLEATRELNPKSYNPKAQKPYNELTKEQQFIDKYIAKAIREYFKELVPSEEALAKEIHYAMGDQWHYSNYGTYRDYESLDKSLKEMLRNAAQAMLKRLEG